MSGQDLDLDGFRAGFWDVFDLLTPLLGLGATIAPPAGTRRAT